MNLIEELQQARRLAGMSEMTNEQAVELAEKKLSGKEKEDFLAKMGGKKPKKDEDADGKPDAKGRTKKDREVDDGKPGPTKDARKSMDQGTIKPRGKKKVSEQLNAVLEGAGLDPLSEEAAQKVDEAYPEEE